MVGDRAVVFGGCGITPTINGVAGEPAIFNETYILHISDGFRWELADVTGDVPSPRWRHTATLLPDNNSIFVFGGLCKVRVRPLARPPSRRDGRPVAVRTR